MNPLKQKAWTMMFYLIKVPVIMFVLIPAGFILDFFVEFPFAVLCALDSRNGPMKAPGRPAGPGKSRLTSFRRG